MTKLIHLSDIHFGANDPALVEAVERRLDAEKPDLVVISGDFTQRARTEEFAAAGQFLERIRTAGHDVLAVPGNHDIPLYDVFRRFLSPLTRYRRFIDETLCPFHEVGGVAVLGINTARSLTFKGGNINHEQVDFIRRTFADVPDDRCKVIVTHHPLFALPVTGPLTGPETGPVTGPGTASPALAKPIDDDKRAIEMVEQLGVDMLLAGHNHRASTNQATDLVKGAGKVLVVQAGTATSTRTRDEQQSFNIIDVDARGITVKLERWDGSTYAEVDVKTFKRSGEHWALADGTDVAEPAA